MKTYRFEDCGCEWPVVGDPAFPGGPPLLAVDPTELPFCERVRALYASGRTKGLFQLESRLGQGWSKKLGPETEEHVSALMALLRPGCLKSKDENGISMTEHYVRRKNGLEPVPPFHPLVDEILRDTYGIIVFQEQSMEIVKAVGGFNLMEADGLRKSIGKKQPEEMAKVRRLFLEKAAEKGVLGPGQAEALFDIIEKSARYSFNRSHSYSYALLSIKTAYAKAHFPEYFLANWLKLAHLKNAKAEEEKADLVADGTATGLAVRAPDVRVRAPRCTLAGPDTVFGLADVKGSGESNAARLVARLGELEAAWGVPLDAMTWEDILFHALDSVPSNAAVPLIEVGGFGWTGVPRVRQANEYRLWQRLTDGEAGWAKLLDLAAAGRLADPAAEADALRGELKPLEMRLRALRKAVKAAPDDATAGESLADLETRVRGLREELRPLEKAEAALGVGRLPTRGLAGAIRATIPLAKSKPDRAEILKAEADMLDRPPAPEVDTPQSIADAEVKYLGVALTATRLDARDTSAATMSCNDFQREPRPGAMAVEVREVTKWLTKKDGREYARMSVTDQTGVLDGLVVWPEQWEKYRSLLRAKNTVLLRGVPDRRGEGFVVDEVVQL